MANGVGLNPSIYTDDFYPEGLLLYQANLIIPVPDSRDRYYLFHNTIDSLPVNTAKYLYLTEVDMSLNGGVGGGDQQESGTPYRVYAETDTLTAVRHGNGRDWWVYAYDLAADAYLCWVVTPAGITGPTLQAVGVDRTQDAGQVVFSPDGTRFAYFSGLTGLDVFLVDRCTSSFVELAHVDVPNNQYPQFYHWGSVLTERALRVLERCVRHISSRSGCTRSTRGLAAYCYVGFHLFPESAFRYTLWCIKTRTGREDLHQYPEWHRQTARDQRTRQPRPCL